MGPIAFNAGESPFTKDPNDNTPAGATALDYIHHIQMLVEAIDPDRLPDDACRKAIGDLADKIDNARVVLGQASRKAGENRQTVNQACTLLLAAARRESPDAAVVCRHAAQDRDAAVAGGIK